MPTLKDYTTRLARLRNTRKLTRTMQMVSANKLRKAQEAQKRAGLFTERVTALLALAATDGEGLVHPLLQARPVQSVHLLVVTSDKGLCGGFNHAVNRLWLDWVRKQPEGRRVMLSFYGRRGYQFARGRYPVRKYYDGASGSPSFESVRRIAAELQGAFLSGACDEVYVASSHFVSALTQRPRVERLLPFPAPQLSGPPADRLFEPGRQALLDLALPQLVAARLHGALLSSAAGEHGARMTAMDNSTRNADTLMEKYTLLRNRVRQSAITRELSEIIAGAEALV